MLIQSSLLSLLLAAAVKPEPPVQIPDVPKKVELKLIPEQGACGGSYKVESDESGALQIGFEDLLSEAATGKYRASCRLAGEIVIPRGYGLDTSAALSGVVKGQLYGGIDNVTGRLKFGVGRYISRDFQLAEYKEPGDYAQDDKLQTVKLDLKALVPELPLNCTEDLTWPVSLFIESTINGAATSRIESLKLDGLTLVAGECPIRPEPIPNLPKPKGSAL